MASVATKLQEAFDALKKEGKKISPFAVEKRAGVSNGSIKNHPVLYEQVLEEKEKYNTDPKKVGKTKAKSNKSKDTVAKGRYLELEDKNEELDAKNKQLKSELKVMADSVAQMTWALHGYQTSTRKNKSNVKNLKV